MNYSQIISVFNISYSSITAPTIVALTAEHRGHTTRTVLIQARKTPDCNGTNLASDGSFNEFCSRFTAADLFHSALSQT
jgi:hypothetical protein